MARQPLGETIWRTDDCAQDCIRYWDDEAGAVYYSARSGDTHLIDMLAVELHHLLRLRPMTERQLLEALADAVEPGHDIEAASHLHENLVRLQGIGLLIESID
nr:HPr-rel-A system PqqD family peptide chaperone [uncultured Roseateles sp.]